MLRKLDVQVQRGEVVLCGLALLVMVLLASLQIALRWGQALAPASFQAVDWFDVIARLMVLWVGVLGASLAAAEGRHIAIELLPKFLDRVGRRRLDAVTSLLTAAVSGLILALALVYFFRSALPDERHLFMVQTLDLAVPRWPFLLVLPLGLTSITFRSALRGVEALLLAERDYIDREDELARELAEFERQREAEAAAQLLAQEERAAAESGRKVTLDPGSARQLVRELLHGGPGGGEGRTPPSSSSRGGAAGQPAAPPPVPPTPRPPERAVPPAPDPHRATRQPRPLVGRSTDEIPVYRADLAEDEDLIEPELRRLQSDDERRVVDSSDMLSSTSDMISSDGITAYDELAEDAVESVAETQRLREETEEEGGETAAELEAAKPPPEPPEGGPRGEGS